LNSGGIPLTITASKCGNAYIRSVISTPMTLALTLIACISIAFVFSVVAKLLRIPEVVGLIAAGLFMGISEVRAIFIGVNAPMVMNIGEVGLFALMFVAGMEVSWSQLYRERRDSIIVALFAALTPFLLGFWVFYALGYPPLVSVAVGICLSVTAEGTKARELLELRILNTRIGALLMGAGIIDDLFGITLLLLVGHLSGNGIAGDAVLLLSAAIAFFLGIAVHMIIGRTTRMVEQLEGAVLFLVVPFFFVSMGLHFSFESLAINPLLMILIIILAVVGKIVGTIVTKPITGLSYKQLYLVGWGMNSRGAVDLAIAFILFRFTLLPVELYSSIIVMALVTTLMFPFFLYRLVKEDPNIMN